MDKLPSLNRRSSTSLEGMKRRAYWPAFASVAVLLSASCFAEQPSSQRAEQIMRADQDDRAESTKPIDWKEVRARDVSRRTEILRLLRDGKLHSEKDFYNAALVFQHGEAIEEIQVAHGLAMTAVAINPESRRARQLAATAWDRALMKLGRPQWYGTQFVREGERWVLYQTDESIVSDQERARWGVRTLQEARDLVKKLNHDEG